MRNMRPGVMATLNLFLETPAPPAVDLPPIRPKSDIMLFFKHYTPSSEQPTLKYAGHWLVPKDSKVKVRAVHIGVEGLVRSVRPSLQFESRYCEAQYKLFWCSLPLTLCFFQQQGLCPRKLGCVLALLPAAALSCDLKARPSALPSAGAVPAAAQDWGPG